MKSMKRLLLTALSVCMLVSMSGCSLPGSSWEYVPKKSGIYILKDRSIIGAEVEDFDNSEFDTPRYSESELMTFVEDEVRDYNEEAAGLAYCRTEELPDKKSALPISIKSLAVADGVATLQLEYAGYKDYLAFNGTTNAVPIQNLIIGTVSDGISSNLDFSDMVKVEKGKSQGAVSADEVRQNSKYTLVAVTGTTQIQVEGTICYISEALTLVDAHTVECENGTQYIIFK